MEGSGNELSQGDAPPPPGEQRGSPEMGVAVISGATFTAKSVTYYNIDGVAIVEGDIALGTVEQVKAATGQAREALAQGPNVAFAVGISGDQFRWPNCQIPYEIDPALPNQQRVTDAIAHWEANSAFRFPLRTPANATQFPNYVRFTDAGGCWSQVGMQGGQQTISLGSGCSAGNAIHEIGHTVGLWHEQSREDRDLFVTIHWEHIQDGMAAQFNQHIADGDDIGAYDYGSIMHYPRNAFSKDGQDTITPTDPNAQIGQRTALSAGDLAAVRTMYPGCHTIKQPFTEPVKKVLDDRPTGIKKIRDDGAIPVKKVLDDKVVVKAPIDIGPIKASLDPITVNVTGPGPISQPVLPFVIAMPHHAVVGQEAGGGDPSAAAYLSSLQRQLLDLEAAIAQTRATAAQANADAARLQEASDAATAAYQQALDDLGGA
jgi:Astacin (Peptidase family M12A)